MSLLANYKKNRKAFADAASANLQKIGKKQGFEQEEGYWQPTVDKSGTGWAIIRFLPAGEGEMDSHVRMISYSFQGPTGQWYIEKSRKTIGEDDPCEEMRTRLFASNEDEAKKYPRSVKYISNILVVKDPGNPENEGKVFLFKYGKQIMDKIIAQDSPEREKMGEQRVMVFDLYDGANFKLIVGRKDKYPTYENSSFAEPTPVAKTDKAIEAVLQQCKPLQPLVAPDKFKSYDDLAARLKKVLGEAREVKATPTREADPVGKNAASPDLPSSLDTDLDNVLSEVDGELGDDKPF